MNVTITHPLGFASLRLSVPRQPSAKPLNSLEQNTSFLFFLLPLLYICAIIVLLLFELAFSASVAFFPPSV